MGEKVNNLRRWEWREQIDFLAKAQMTAKANASSKAGERVCPMTCRLRPLKPHPSLIPCFFANRDRDGTGCLRAADPKFLFDADNVFVSAHVTLSNNATGQQQN